MKDKELRRIIGERAKSRRTELNLTQPYVADKMGVTASTIQRYEAGTIDNTKKMVLEGLSEALHVSVEWLKSAKRLLLEFEVSSDSLLLPYLILFQHSFFHYIDQSIQSHCHNTEQNNRHEKPIHLKYLTGIDDQISKSAFGSEKFSDNDSHKTKSDIDFHIAYDCRNRGRQYNFCKRMPAVSVQCIYQFDLFLIDIDKGGIQIQDTSEDGDGHSGNNNCF